MKEWLEYVVVRVLAGVLALLPRRASRRLGEWIGVAAFSSMSRLRQTGLANLAAAFPESDDLWRQRTLRKTYINLGAQLAEFCKMSGYSRRTAEQIIHYDGLSNYLQARDRGKGVLVLTAHLGAWELSSYFHSLVGHPMGLLIRRLDNPRIDRFVNRIRCRHGNWVVHKDDFARGLITAMRSGQTVGILMDTNMTPPQGVFVPFFGRLACTASGMARIAGKTGAAVLPGFLLRDEHDHGYTLHFGEELTLTDTGNAEADSTTNTARFTAELERYIRLYPEQWLWVHRRWKTRPAGEGGTL